MDPKLIALLIALAPLYEEWQKDAADGVVSVDEGFALGDHALTILADHQVTIEQLHDLLGQIKPLLPLITHLVGGLK